ncbi:MAG TPA: DUF2892 domain-containing protein [Calditerricola sp.]|uniref:Inner membrane protein YgaP-like transmembrane domain-containing protein n=2 Tax=Calditerricola satsumensis TaxID=373054 RepID=A0A8J3BFG6_9BACI|nr:DUF2892 domain-containing protein [Calditerricola satsumensis]GGK03618.1 hypothetical protein GCM10007043_17200 [Calditerricola satsumensis]
MKKNVGTLDAMIRLVAGFTGLAWAIAMASRPFSRPPVGLMMLSALKIAEGLTRWCPMLALLGISTRELDRNVMKRGQHLDERGTPRRIRFS